jgi:hypothetical protein
MMPGVAAGTSVYGMMASEHVHEAAQTHEREPGSAEQQRE